MVGWHHRLDGREFVQALGVGDGQGSLACCSPWGCKESDTTERLNNNGCIKQIENKQSTCNIDGFRHSPSVTTFDSKSLFYNIR